MIPFFFGIALILSLLIFIFPKRKIIATASIIYVVFHIALTVYSFENLNLWDSVYFRFDSLAVLLNGLLSILLVPVIFHAKLYLQRHVHLSLIHISEPTRRTPI